MRVLAALVSAATAVTAAGCGGGDAADVGLTSAPEVRTQAVARAELLGVAPTATDWGAGFRQTREPATASTILCGVEGPANGGVSIASRTDGPPRLNAVTEVAVHDTAVATELFDDFAAALATCAPSGGTAENREPPVAGDDSAAATLVTPADEPLVSEVVAIRRSGAIAVLRATSTDGDAARAAIDRVAKVVDERLFRLAGA